MPNSIFLGEKRQKDAVPPMDGIPERYAGHSLARKPLVPTLMMMGLQRRIFATNPCLASQPWYASSRPPAPHTTCPACPPAPEGPPAPRAAEDFDSGVGEDELVEAEEATSARQWTLYAGAVESICSKPLEMRLRISLLDACDTCEHRWQGPTLSLPTNEAIPQERPSTCQKRPNASQGPTLSLPTLEEIPEA